LRKAAKRWKRRNDDGEGGTGLGDRNRRCVYDVYDVEGLPHEQLFDSAYVMVTGNEYGALEGGADEESGLESPLGACSEFDDEEGEQKQDDENVGKEEGEGEEKEEDGVEEEVDDKEQDGVEEEVDDNEDGDDNATGSETESEGEEKSYCDDLLADEPGSMQSHVSQCLLSTEVEGKNDGGGRRVGVGWASTRYTGHKGRRKEGHSGVAVTSSDKVSALAEGPEKGAYMPEQNGAEAVRIGGISSVERTAKGTGEQIPRKLRKNVTLLFDSRFEGGNLARVFKVGETEYDLLVMPDINTRAGYSGGHTQWYYFAVSNMRKGISYTFNIVNLLKDDSLYNRGMRPAMFSERDFADAKVKDIMIEIRRTIPIMLTMCCVLGWLAASWSPHRLLSKPLRDRKRCSLPHTHVHRQFSLRLRHMLFCALLSVWILGPLDIFERITQTPRCGRLSAHVDAMHLSGGQ
jgi:hypothetical protein